MIVVGAGWDLYGLLAALLETLVFGLYLCLFLFTMYLSWLERQSQQSSQGHVTIPATSTIFLVVMVLMFLNAALHEAITLHRGMKVLDIAPRLLSMWEVVSTYQGSPMIWMGEFLAILRCYTVWGENLSVVFLPIVIALTAIAIDICTFVWTSSTLLATISLDTMLALSGARLFLMLAQNVLTTCLMVWRILRQHWRSKAAGLVMLGPSRSIGLMAVARILVESALPFTLILVLMVALRYASRPEMAIIFGGAFIPCIGISFALISIRVHFARENLSRSDGQKATVSWLLQSLLIFHDSETDSTNEMSTRGATEAYGPSSERSSGSVLSVPFQTRDSGDVRRDRCM